MDEHEKNPPSDLEVDILLQVVEHNTRVGFKVFEGVVYEYECERCIYTTELGRWTQAFIDKFHGGQLENLNVAHKHLKFPYGHLHEIKKIGGENG